ncbi:lipid-A-disaccharide synthase [bacterium]|nr:lipid-A-disaccharide synthase [bacterium]MBU1072317.1 lipid-A-disaccharide synthase [bacterium]MBU1675773.1 lipid-A-disaccharide synthase [bacterium]
MPDQPVSASLHVFLACGEASGERYGAELVRALRARRPQTRFTALGGEILAAAGVEIVCERSALSIMGFGEVLAALPTLWRARRTLRRHLAGGGVDLCVPVDFPGFNLGLASHARHRGVPVFYLVAPQLWAWGGWRAGRLRRAADLVGTVLPFEPAFFRARGVPAVWLGHPLIEGYDKSVADRDRRAREARFISASSVLTVGLLPGSRRQELDMLLPLMLETVARLKSLAPHRSFRCVVSRAPGVREDALAPVRDAGADVSDAPLDQLLRELDLALVCSGTASLETALAGVPHAIAYRTSAFNHLVARRLVRIKRIGLANLVLDRELVREFVQDAATPDGLAQDLADWLTRGSRRARFASSVDALRETLGAPGVWNRAADAALSLVG